MTNNEKIQGKDKPINILINNRPFKAPKPTMTGKEIKDLANGPAGYLLVLVVGDPDEVAGGDDKIINDAESIDLQSGMRFRIVNPATFGDDTKWYYLHY